MKCTVYTFYAKLVWDFFYEPLWLWQTLVQVSSRQSGCFWKNFTLLLFGVELWTLFLRPSHSEGYSSRALPGSTADTCSAPIWVVLDVHFPRGGEHGSWSRLLSCGVENCAELMLQLRFFAELVWAFRSRALLYVTVICSPSGRCRRRVFWTLDDSRL